MKVHYPQPPRKWDFYVGLIIWFLILLSPIALLSLTWATVLPIASWLGIASFVLLFAVATLGSSSMKLYANFYDSLFLEIEDASYRLLVPKSPLREAEDKLVSLGFEIFGGINIHFLVIEQVILEWIYLDETKIVLVELAESQSISPYSLSFSTWFSGERLVETVYPISEQINDKDFRLTGISESLETAYNFHLRQVAEFETLYGEAIKIENMRQVVDLVALTQEKFAVRVKSRLRNRYFITKISEVTIFSSVIFTVVGSCIALSSTSSFPTPIWLTLIYFFLGFILRRRTYIPLPQVQDIKKEK